MHSIKTFILLLKFINRHGGSLILLRISNLIIQLFRVSNLLVTDYTKYIQRSTSQKVCATEFMFALTVHIHLYIYIYILLDFILSFTVLCIILYDKILTYLMKLSISLIVSKNFRLGGEKILRCGLGCCYLYSNKILKNCLMVPHK